MHNKFYKAKKLCITLINFALYFFLNPSLIILNCLFEISLDSSEDFNLHKNATETTDN